jgi:leucyl/phenylalanyl-tRNA--protein transferase
MSRGFGPEELLNCYRRGVFPMAEDADDSQLFIVDPDMRGVFPLNELHVSKSLKKVIRRDEFIVTADTAFSLVMDECAKPAAGRESTWINDPILNLYSALHRMGYAHSIECWQNDELVGGLYGVSIGGAFFGESMFSRVSNASKVALIHLAARLIGGGYKLLDAQFMTPHLASLGAKEITRSEFQKQLHIALEAAADFYSVDKSSNPELSNSSSTGGVTGEISGSTASKGVSGDDTSDCDGIVNSRKRPSGKDSTGSPASNDSAGKTSSDSKTSEAESESSPSSMSISSSLTGGAALQLVTQTS